MSQTREPGHRLLYIDDDAAFARLVEKDLTRAGYRVTLAENGEDGLARLAQESFDAIALDHFMPGRGGLEVLADIRLLADAPPVVYVTGTDEGRVAVSALKAGASDYVIKDLASEFFALLRAAIEQALRGEEMRRRRDEAEREMREARDRAEALLREVNHRIGNSLQLVSTFVHMQSSALEDPAAREALRETQNRIGAVAQVHRRLYTADSVGMVEMSEYLSGLLGELHQSLASGGKSHPIELHAQRISIATDKAVSVGVIVTELVTNAYKYAYPEDASGKVRVFLNGAAEGLLDLIVEDDGIGWSADAAPRGSGLGQKIVRAMAVSLRSNVEFDPAHKGTRALIAFAP